MVSLDNVREEFKQRLANKPHCLSADELNEVLTTLLIPNDTKSKMLFKRFNYWMGMRNMDKKIVCANVELVRFGILRAKPGQMSLCDTENLKRFFKKIRVEVNSIDRLPDTVEKRALIIDDWVNASLNSKSNITKPPNEEIMIESNDGNKRTQLMQYISVSDLIKCMYESENTLILIDHPMNVMASLRIYENELLTTKDKILEKNEDNIIATKLG